MRGSVVGHSINLVGVPTELLASCAFNDHPVPLHISGVREMNKNLFEMLSQAADLPDAGEAFSCYMMAMFAIDPEQRERTIDQPSGPAAPTLSLVVPAFDQRLGIRQQWSGRSRAQGLGGKPLRHIPDFS